MVKASTMEQSCSMIELIEIDHQKAELWNLKGFVLCLFGKLDEAI
jgi:hypothetical protein